MARLYQNHQQKGQHAPELQPSILKQTVSTSVRMSEIFAPFKTVIYSFVGG